MSSPPFTDASANLAAPPRGPGRVLVFDSGVGGLTVAREISAARATLGLDYAADTGFFPYGDKSDEALRERLPRVCQALYEAARPDVFVIACNTASTLALSEVRGALPIPVVGTVPAIKPAAAASRSGVIGLLATPGTVRRAYTARLVNEFASGKTVILQGSLALVTLAEAVARGEAVPDTAFAEAQAPLFAAAHGEQIDTVVLACTHFPLVRDRLERTAPHPVAYIDSGAAIARQTLRLVDALPAPSADARPPHGFITSDPALQGGLVTTLRRFGFGEVNAVPLPLA
jgi:glutamate racemase